MGAHILRGKWKYPQVGGLSSTNKNIKQKQSIPHCERELLESMSGPLLLIHLRLKQDNTKNKRRNQKEKGGRSLNKAITMQHH